MGIIIFFPVWCLASSQSLRPEQRSLCRGSFCIEHLHYQVHVENAVLTGTCVIRISGKKMVFNLAEMSLPDEILCGDAAALRQEILAVLYEETMNRERDRVLPHLSA